MIRKLKSHLRNKKGFTLIELLIVIAIIAVLVLIVVVAIDPVQRLQDAANRAAVSNVRSAGSLIETCITAELSETPTPGTIADCDDATKVGAYGNVPTGVTILGNDAGSADTQICAIDEGESTVFQRYQSANGEVDDPADASGLTDCT